MKYLLIFLISCASSSEIKESSPREHQRFHPKELQLEKDVAEKFVIKEKPIKKEKPKKAKIKKKKKKVFQKKKVSSLYPENYPEIYKEYDKKYGSTWGEFDPSFLKEGEKIEMRVRYLGLGLGTIFMEIAPSVLVGEEEAYSFKAVLKTARFYRYIYELHDTLDAEVHKGEFLPIRYALVQRESKKEIDDIQFFDREKLMLYYRYRRFRKDKKTLVNRKDDLFIPKYSIDPFSLLYFVRGLPLETGRKFSFPVVTRNKLWIFRFSVGEKEVIKTIKGRREVYKVSADIGEEGSFIKKGQLNLWFDTEKGHMLWKMRVGTKIGSLYAEVIKSN